MVTLSIKHVIHCYWHATVIMVIPPVKGIPNAIQTASSNPESWIVFTVNKINNDPCCAYWYFYPAIFFLKED